jgi:hypothetical protein
MHFPCLAFLLISAALGTAACQSKTAETTAEKEPAVAPVILLTPGLWRGELAVQGQEIPFLFEVKTEIGKPVVYLINKGLDGEQRLRCPRITQAGDSVTVRMPTTDAALVLWANGTETLKGTWVKYDTKKPFRMPLVATAGRQRLFTDKGIDERGNSRRTEVHGESINIKFKFLFQDATEASYTAVGIFRIDSSENSAKGTFSTSTDEYRYLDGNLASLDDGTHAGSHILLSTFDGNHAFLFDAIPTEDRLIGNFYSDKYGHETFTAVLDPKAKLPTTR